MRVYADSSFIVALYLNQQSSQDAVAFMQHHGQALPFNPWHRLEVRNALRLAVFQSVIETHQGKTQLKQIESDLKDQTLLFHQPIDWIGVLREAERLGEAHNMRIGCRSSDLFHVAAASDSQCDRFLTFDEKQIALAKAAGLVIGP